MRFLNESACIDRIGEIAGELLNEKMNSVMANLLKEDVEYRLFSWKQNEYLAESVFSSRNEAKEMLGTLSNKDEYLIVSSKKGV